MSSKFKPWFLLAIIFVVGVVTGVALTVGVGPFVLRYMHPLAQHDVNKSWMAYLTHKLNLTADQQAKIEPIVADAASQLQLGHHEEMERDAQIFKAADDQISALLTPEQKAELQKMESEREKMFSGHMRPWGTPHGAGPGGMHHHEEPEDGPPPPPPPPVTPTNAAPSAPGTKP